MQENLGYHSHGKNNYISKNPIRQKTNENAYI